MSQRQEMAILTRMHIEIVDGRTVRKTKVAGMVKVMARVDGYAMVRFKGAMPFVVSQSDLQPLEARTEII